MANRKISTICLVGICLISLSMAMDMDDTEEYSRPKIIDAGSKTFHWLCTLFLSLILPSYATSLSFAGKTYSAVFLQIVSGLYAIIEAVVWRFGDWEDVENRTSRGTAWFLLGLLWVTIFFGGLASGTGILIRNRKLQSFVSHAGEKRLSYVHRGLSLLVTITGWVKSCLAPVALFGFCREEHTGQCIAHGIMGSAFILYGFIYLAVLVTPWIRNSNSGYSQDYIDSWVMCLWGIVNTFTEHRWGREGWSMGDYQHTLMGIIWWCGGILGIFLSRGGRRTFVPSLIIIFTGWAMSEHSQHLIISTKVHYFFGLVLMSGGALRIVEISFLLKDQRALDKIYSFQYLPPFCLVCAGIMFMGANEEQLVLVLRLGADHSSYTLLLGAAAFLVYFWMITCLEFYVHMVEKGERGFLDKYPDQINEDPSDEFELHSNSALANRVESETFQI